MLEWGAKEGGLVPILLDGEQVATADPAFWWEGAELEIGGQVWQFTRDGGDRIARPAGGTEALLRARRKGLFSAGWIVEGEGADYEIGPEGFLGATHQVLRAGRRIGSGSKAGFWSPRVTLDIDPSVPPVHQLFLLWISHIIRRRAAAAAAQP